MHEHTACHGHCSTAQSIQILSIADKHLIALHAWPHVKEFLVAQEQSPTSKLEDAAESAATLLPLALYANMILAYVPMIKQITRAFPTEQVAC